jgi:hypothetical protein
MIGTKVIVECKPDEKLVRKLGVAKIRVAHQSSKGEVCNYLFKTKNHLALIDEDPDSSQPKHLQKFTVIEEKHDVKKLFYKAEGKTIFVLKPRLEEWILKRCIASGVKPETHFLNSNNKRLKDEINNKLHHFESLLNDLINQKDEGVLYLKEQLDKVMK